MRKLKYKFWDSIHTTKEEAEKWVEKYRKEYGAVCEIEQDEDGDWNVYVVGFEEGRER